MRAVGVRSGCPVSAGVDPPRWPTCRHRALKSARPVLLWNEDGAYLVDQRIGRTFGIDEATADAVEAVLVLGSVETATAVVDPARLRSVASSFAAAGVLLDYPRAGGSVSHDDNSEHFTGGSAARLGPPQPTSSNGHLAEIVGELGAGVTVHDMYDPVGSAFYDDISRHDHHEVREILAAIRGVPGEVLDLAAGSGRLTVPMLASGRTVTALELSHTMLDLLRRRLSELPAELRGRAAVVRRRHAHLPAADRVRRDRPRHDVDLAAGRGGPGGVVRAGTGAARHRAGDS